MFNSFILSRNDDGNETNTSHTLRVLRHHNTYKEEENDVVKITRINVPSPLFIPRFLRERKKSGDRFLSRRPTEA